MDAKKAIVAALRMQCALEDERRNISRDLCGVRAEIRRLLALDALKRKGRPGGKRSGGTKRRKSVAMRGNVQTRAHKGKQNARRRA